MEESIFMVPEEQFIADTAELLILLDVKPCGTPSTVFKPETGDDEILENSDAANYKKAVARLLYLSGWRYDIQWTVGDLCRSMKGPTNLAMRKLRHLTR